MSVSMWFSILKISRHAGGFRKKILQEQFDLLNFNSKLNTTLFISEQQKSALTYE